MTDQPPSGNPATDLDALKRVRDSFSRQGLVGTLGAWLVELEPGRAVIEVPFSNRVAGQSRRFHAAVVAGIAQACGGTAAASLLLDGADLAPRSVSVSYEGGTEGDLLRAEGQATAEGSGRWSVKVAVTCRSGDAAVTCAAADLVFEARAKSR